MIANQFLRLRDNQPMQLDRHTVRVNASQIHDLVIEDDYIKKIRASYYLLGALLGKYRKAEVALPGGCNIGLRPIDQHRPMQPRNALDADHICARALDVRAHTIKEIRQIHHVRLFAAGRM